MSKGKEIIEMHNQLYQESMDQGLETEHLNIVEHSKLLKIHSRALAAHCECLGMNADNCIVACLNERPLYENRDYNRVMIKWGLINDKGELLI